MNPGFDLRLKSMRRALTTVILPALDAGNQLAQEQGALMIAHLDMMASQWSRTDAYARLCLDDVLTLVGQLDAAGGDVTRAAMDALLATAGEAHDDPEAAYNRISGGLEALVRAVDVDGDADFRRKLHHALLLYGNRQATRDRAWFAACGFDVNAAELPSIDEMIGRGAHSGHG